MTDQEIVVAAAEKVMGWRIHVANTVHWTDAATWNQRGDYPIRAEVGRWNPVTKIADAWMLVEALHAKTNWRLDLRYTDYRRAKGVYQCRVELCLHYEDDSAPRAITFAALRAVGVEV